MVKCKQRKHCSTITNVQMVQLKHSWYIIFLSGFWAYWTTCANISIRRTITADLKKIQPADHTIVSFQNVILCTRKISKGTLYTSFQFGYKVSTMSLEDITYDITI